MTSSNSIDAEDAGYDEIAVVRQSLERRGLNWSDVQPLARISVDVGAGQHVSALKWGTGEPDLVFLHGRGHNAYTWDHVVSILGVESLAIDLPGHGHSDWRPDHDYGARANATAVVAVLQSAASRADAVIGMSLGGSTNICLAATSDPVRRAIVVDTTPSRRGNRSELTKAQRGATQLLDGPFVFDSFATMLEAAVRAAPNRAVESLRDGVLHNARQMEDGRWMWRYDPDRSAGAPRELGATWEDLSSIRAPVMLVIGDSSGRVTEQDIAEFVARQPHARVERVMGAGHSVQSDAPNALASLIADFVSTTSTGPT